MNIDDLIAIDVHVHLEHDGGPTDTDEAARKYFGTGVAAHGAQALADYYRSRKMGCVVFTVDEHLTGRPHLKNDEILAFAAANADIVIPFVSVDPTRGAPAVDEARRLVAAGGVRGLKLHPPLQQFFPNDRAAYPIYEIFAEAKLPVLIHTGHSGIGTGMRAGGGIRLKYGNPMNIDDVGRLSRHAHHFGPPVVPVAGRSDLGLLAQAAGLYRSVGLVAQVLFADAGAVRKHAAQTQGSVRIRLSLDHSGSMAGGLREDRHS
jgi:hypothetical protein